MGKLAIIQNGDTPQIESTAVMLRYAGYDQIKICGPELRSELVAAGCDTVLSVQTMYALGYDRLDPSIQEATPADMERCDLFCEIKVRNVPKIVSRWPRLKGRMAWWRVNGAQPEICPKGGDEVNLPCPVITACFWYGTNRYKEKVTQQGQASLEHLQNRSVTLEDFHRWAKEAVPGHHGLAYTFWPPYPRSAEYDRIDRSKLVNYDPPYSLCHSGRSWGFGPIVDDCVKMGVRFYGNNSPAGQIHHSQVAGVVSSSLALVHLKSVDCPGWALYEAILGGCPVVTARLLNSRMLAYSLLENGETCYEFGVPASLEYGRGEMEYPKCVTDIREALYLLSSPTENRRIGENGRRRLNELMWNPQRDGESFNQFMKDHYG